MSCCLCAWRTRIRKTDGLYIYIYPLSAFFSSFSPSFSYTYVKDNTHCALTRTSCLMDNSTNGIVGVIHCSLMACRSIYVIGCKKKQTIISKRICIRKENEVRSHNCLSLSTNNFLFFSHQQHPFSSQLEAYACEDELLSYYSIISFVYVIKQPHKCITHSYQSGIGPIINSWSLITRNIVFFEMNLFTEKETIKE